MAGSYSFTVTGADGMRLRVGGGVVADQWANRGVGTFSGTVTVPARNAPIRLEYSDVSPGASQVHLSMNGTVIAQAGLTAVRFSTSRTVYDTATNGSAPLSCFSSGRTITKIDQRGTWHYTHADNGTTDSVTPPGQAQATVTTYDPDGNALRVDDPVNGSTNTAYDDVEKDGVQRLPGRVVGDRHRSRGG